MKRICLVLVVVVAFVQSATSQSRYFPPAGANWEQKSPSELGFNPTNLQSAVDFALANNNSVETDLRIAILKAFSREPYHRIVGPTRDRGLPAGMIIKDGYIAAQWGDLDRVDMTFSVTKSYLSTMAGLALDDKLIADVHDRVSNYVWDNTFDGDHNGSITWDHLLTQSSDWSGSLFGIHDWTDRPPRTGTIDDWRRRDLREPGTFYQYNDVRVNVLAYSLLQVWRKPLPMVLKDRIMDPIGASTTWRWHGYEDSQVAIDGLTMQSVSGGGHHGGGMFINTYDQARFGLLFARGGNWNGQQLISKAWIDQIAKPSSANAAYGYMWWTLKGNTKWDQVPDHVYYAAGFGGNYIVVDEQNDLVVVLRWIDTGVLDEFMTMVYSSIQD